LLLEAATPEVRRALHLRIAGCLGSSQIDQFRLLQHLLSAGDIDRAVTMLVEDIRTNREPRMHDSVGLFDYIQSLPSNWPRRFTRASSCVADWPAARRAVGLQTVLIGYSTFTARTSARAFSSSAEQLRRDTGLDLIAEYAGKVPESELLAKALGDAQKRYDATPEHERGYAILPALMHLGQLTTHAWDGDRSHDRPLLEAMPSLAPLAALSPALAIVQKNIDATLELYSGRAIGRARRTSKS